MEELIINIDNLKKIVRYLLNNDSRVIATTAENKFKELEDAEQLVLNPGSVPTSSSFKEYFFPKTEPLFFINKIIMA